MSGGDVVALLRLLAEHRIDVWVDGGWGVDALLGEQTRPHSDVDIAVRHEENDYCDVMALCQRFGIAVPAEYDRFR